MREFAKSNIKLRYLYVISKLIYKICIYVYDHKIRRFINIVFNVKMFDKHMIVYTISNI